jgi:hypothetical protein
MLNADEHDERRLKMQRAQQQAAVYAGMEGIRYLMSSFWMFLDKGATEKWDRLGKRR